MRFHVHVRLRKLSLYRKKNKSSSTENTSDSWLLFRIIRLCARARARLARWRAISAGAMARSGPNYY